MLLNSRDKTRQLLKADCEEISGSGKQVANRHVCDQGEREGIGDCTERLWSGRGRPAVTGHIWPLPHSWTSMSGCQVSERGPVGALHWWCHLLAVYINPRLSNHCIAMPLPITPKQVTLNKEQRRTVLYLWDSIVHRKQYKKCVFCLWNGNPNLVQRNALYLHASVQQHDSCFQNKLISGRSVCLLESNERLSAEKKSKCNNNNNNSIVSIQKLQ